MGKGIFRVTKMKWYYENEDEDRKYEIFKDISKEENSYYYLKKQEKIWIEDKDLIEKYVKRNKKLNNIYIGNKENKKVQLFEKITIYVKNDKKFKKMELLESKEVLYRKFSKKRIEEGKLPECYKLKKALYAKAGNRGKEPTVYSEKDSEDDFSFYEMTVQERNLTEKRAVFIIEVEKVIYNFFKFIRENHYDYKSDGIRGQIREKIQEMIGIIDKYNLCAFSLDSGKEDLIDIKSNKKIIEVKGNHKKCSKIIEEYLKKSIVDRDKDELFNQLDRYFSSQYKLLANRLGIYQTINKTQQKTTVNDIKGLKIEDIEKNVKKCLRDIYKLPELIKVIKNSLNKEKELKDSKNLELFNIIKKHYQDIFKTWKMTVQSNFTLFDSVTSNLCTNPKIVFIVLFIIIYLVLQVKSVSYCSNPVLASKLERMSSVSSWASI